MTPYETIRLTASSLVDGEDSRGLCPWCFGGGSKEDSFIVTRDGGSAKFICHRDSCTSHSRGVLSISGAPTPIHRIKPSPKKHEFDRDTFPFTAKAGQFLQHKYEISHDLAVEMGIRLTVREDFVEPIRS